MDREADMSRYFWMPSADGTVIYVKEIYDGWIFKNKIRTIAHFYASGKYADWEGAVQIARDLIKRLQPPTTKGTEQ